MWSDTGTGEGLTLAGDVGADAMGTLLPQATVPPLVSDPVVGGSGQYCEDAGQDIKQNASNLKAPLHPHAKEAAAKDIIGRTGSHPCVGGSSSASEGLPSQVLLPDTSKSPTPATWWLMPCNPSLKEAQARRQKSKARPRLQNEFWAGQTTV